jgi:hypothetical protein
MTERWETKLQALRTLDPPEAPWGTGRTISAKPPQTPGPRARVKAAVLAGGVAFAALALVLNAFQGVGSKTFQAASSQAVTGGGTRLGSANSESPAPTAVPTIDEIAPALARYEITWTPISTMPDGSRPAVSQSRPWPLLGTISASFKGPT